MFERDVLKKRAITGQSPNKWENYQKARNEVNRAIRKAKRNFFTSHLKESDGDVKGTWEIINGLLGKKSKNAMINNLKVNGETLTDASSIADALNEYFVNVGPKLADQISESEVNPVDFLDQAEPSVFRFRRINVDEVSKLIAGLKMNKATGLDQIPARALKVGASVVS